MSSFDGTQRQYPHLSASMLGYVYMNLISILKRIEPEEVVRVATDTLVIQKCALHKLESVEAEVPTISEEEFWTMQLLKNNEPRGEVGLAQCRDKGEQLYLPDKRAEYYPKLEHIKQK